MRESHEAGTLAGQEQELLSRALELSARDAEAVMVPRRDIVAVAADARVEDLERAAARSGRSRLPVFSTADLDELVGVVNAKDLLRLDPARRDQLTARDLARPAMLVPESRRIHDLLRDMRDRRQHIALVFDEYGSVTGLVSLEDIVEELIGEFEDESDRVSRRLRRRPDGRVQVPGDLRPFQLEELVGVKLPEGPYETLAGFITRALDRLPVPGDVVAVGGVELVVAATDRNRVTEVVVRPVSRGAAPTSRRAERASARPSARRVPRAGSPARRSAGRAPRGARRTAGSRRGSSRRSSAPMASPCRRTTARRRGTGQGWRLAGRGAEAGAALLTLGQCLEGGVEVLCPQLHAAGFGAGRVGAELLQHRPGEAEPVAEERGRGQVDVQPRVVREGLGHVELRRPVPVRRRAECQLGRGTQGREGLVHGLVAVLHDQTPVLDAGLAAGPEEGRAEAAQRPAQRHLP